MFLYTDDFDGLPPGKFPKWPKKKERPKSGQFVAGATIMATKENAEFTVSFPMKLSLKRRFQLLLKNDLEIGVSQPVEVTGVWKTFSLKLWTK